MATDEELVEKLKEFLRSSDLSTTTTGTVRRHLESEFSTNLSDKKGFIREQVELFLSTGIQNEIEGGEAAKDGNGEDHGSGDNEVGEEEEEEEEEEEDVKEPRNIPVRKKRKLSKCNNDKVEKKRGGGGGFTKPCSLSEDLQNFVGESTLARTEVVKRIWAYIRENSLQDPANKRKILCDDKLKVLFNVDSIDMFQMNKALTKHIWPLEDGGNAGGGSSKSKEKETTPKKDKQIEVEGSAKKAKTGQSGLLAPLRLSDELRDFLGTGETSLARSDVVKRMWAYIKENDLQDPSDKRNIICDDKLKDLFKVDTFNGFSVAKYLSPHFIKD